MSARTPILRLLPPQKVAGSNQIAPLQFTYADTARLLSVSVRTVKRLVANGELATVGEGRLKRIPYDSIVVYLNRHRTGEAA
jgi:excisionase family DNA binding protein